MRALQQTHGLTIALDGEKVALAFDTSRIPAGARDSVYSRMGVRTGGNAVYLSNRPTLRRNSDELYLQTRSLIGILFFLSHNIEVPSGDVSRGLVTVTRNADGTEFDWNELCGGLMKVENTAASPLDAFVKIKYRGSWFYIADNDLDSKSTFMLLNQLFNLLAGDVKKAAPVLTIPVG